MKAPQILEPNDRIALGDGPEFPLAPEEHRSLRSLPDAAVTLAQLRAARRLRTAIDRGVHFPRDEVRLLSGPERATVRHDAFVKALKDLQQAMRR